MSFVDSTTYKESMHKHKSKIMVQREKNKPERPFQPNSNFLSSLKSCLMYIKLYQFGSVMIAVSDNEGIMVMV